MDEHLVLLRLYGAEVNFVFGPRKRISGQMRLAITAWVPPEGGIQSGLTAVKNGAESYTYLTLTATAPPKDIIPLDLPNFFCESLLEWGLGNHTHHHGVVEFVRHPPEVEALEFFARRIAREILLASFPGEVKDEQVLELSFKFEAEPVTLDHPGQL